MIEENQDNSDRREIDKKRYKFDASINVAHILTTLAMVFALFNWGGGVNKSQAIAEVEIKGLQKSREQDRAEILQAIIEINRKLDQRAR